MNLLSLDQAALLILHAMRALADPYAPDALKKAVEDKELAPQFRRAQWFIRNAIDAEELPALPKSISRPEEKRMLDAVNAPEDVRKNFPKQYNYWITFTDLRAFLERPDFVSRNSYAHARQALARVAWMLATRTGKQNDLDDLFAHLEQIAEELSGEGTDPRLGETTLRGCVREILAAGEELKAPKT